MTSSVDPTAEIEAIMARLGALEHKIYDGVEQGTKLLLDGFGKKAPYRDLQPGSTTPKSGQRMLSVPEQGQPQIWAFQVAHVAPTRKQSTELAIETDKSLIGWSPSANAGEIGTFFFTVYDQFAKNGDRVAWITTRFYETTLGMNPDLS